MLRSVGYEKLRWVVDWEDHVWVELFLPLQHKSSEERPRVGVTNASTTGRWVHCDPCEASIDEPLIYQGWGTKNQTFIMAFYNPFHKSSGVDSHEVEEFDLIEDVTSSYTNDQIETIYGRRGIDKQFVTETIQQVSNKFNEMLQRTIGAL
jgi:hypothetical protein